MICLLASNHLNAAIAAVFNYYNLARIDSIFVAVGIYSKHADLSLDHDLLRNVIKNKL